MEKLKSPQELEQLRAKIIANRDPNRQIVSVCTSSCETRGGREIIDAFKEELKKQGLDGKVDVRGTGCLGLCEQGPIVIVYPQTSPTLKFKDQMSLKLYHKLWLKKK